MHERTQKSYYEVYDASDSLETAHFTKFGIAASLAVYSARGGIGLRYLSAVVEPAINDDRIVFFYNVDGQPVGYYIYALVAPEVDQRLSETGWPGWFEMHHSEWNEGHSLWIVDLVAMPGHTKYILRRIRERFLTNRVSYTRLRKGVVVVGGIHPQNWS